MYNFTEHLRAGITCGRFVDTTIPNFRYRRGLTSSQIVTGLIFAPVVQEFGFRGPFLKLAQNIGLLVGAAFWGLASDVWGRRSVR
jgi:hypothetical protein